MRKTCCRGHPVGYALENIGKDGGCKTCSMARSAIHRLNKSSLKYRYVDWGTGLVHITHCQKGHPRKPDNLITRGCRECSRQRQREKWKTDPMPVEKRREHYRLYRERNPELKKQKDKRDYEKHKKERLKQQKMYNSLNQESRRKYYKEKGRLDREALVPFYVAARLKMPVKDLTQELYELAKTKTLLIRALRRANNAD
jgi:hypothetical protein